MYVSLPDLTETCFEVNMLGEFAPGRSVCSVGEGTEGGVGTVPYISLSPAQPKVARPAGFFASVHVRPLLARVRVCSL